MDFTIGIDVGAEKKGYHVAVKKINDPSIYALFHAYNPEHIIQYIKNIINILHGQCITIAIDCPPKAIINSEETREAERELVKKGYRIFWTPRNEEKKQDWMVHGQKLWDLIAESFPDTKIIETFPTANSDFLLGSNNIINLDILFGKSKRAYYKDYIDAVICACTAEKSAIKETEILGKNDILGPVHLLRLNTRHYVLCLIHDEEKNRTLLGYKKKGFGEARWNGFGGKVEEQDLPDKKEQKAGITQYIKAIKREVKEECGLTITNFKEMGLINFMFDIEDHIFYVHVFKATEFDGTPVESDEMLPQWFDIDDIPYDKMWLDDPFWLPLLYQDVRFKALFIFSDHDTIKHHTLEILPD